MRRKRRPSPSVKQSVDNSKPSLLRLVVIVAVVAAVVTFFMVRRPPPIDPIVPQSRSIRDLLGEAATDIESGNFDSAESILESILQLDANNGTAWLYRGQLAREQGNLELAMEACLRVPDLPPNLGGTARFMEGTILLEKKLARKAEARLLRAIELNPAYLQSHERLLALYVLQMRQPETLRALDRIENLRGLTFDEMILRTSAGEQITETEQAIGMLEAFLAADPEDTASSVATARYFNLDGRHADAAHRLAPVLRREPHDESVRGVLIESLVALGRIDDAAVHVREHPPNASSRGSYWQSVGNLAVAQGNARRAVECFEFAIKQDPTNQQLHYRAGLLYQKLGEQDKATRLLETAALLDRLRQRTTIAANADRSKTDMLIPVLVEVGNLLSQLDLHRAATNWYQLALSLNPKDTAAIAGLQRAYEVLQQRQSEQPETNVLASSGQATAQQQAGPAASSLDSNTKISQQPPQQAAGSGPIELRDVHQDVQLNFRYFNGQTKFKYLIEAMGGGVAVLDYDSDGWPDLHFPQGCHLPVDLHDRSHHDRLFRNVDGRTFADVSVFAGLDHAGYGQGCVAGDFDNDGFVDLVVANFGRNVAYRNNGDGTFTDVTELVGFRQEKMSSSLAAVDLNRDGNLDLYVVNYVDALKVCRNAQGEYSTCRPENFNGEQDELYLNRGDGSLEDITANSGITISDGKGLGVVTADLDGDGWPDVYVANDTTPNFLFHNQGQQSDTPGRVQLVERGLLSGAAMSGEGRAEAGMGVACADLNGDALLDVFVTNYFNESNTAYLNHGGTFFEDVSRAWGLAGPSMPMVGFGTQAVDLDLDGWPDLFVANGHIDDFGDPNQAWKMPSQVFRNLGGGQFAEASNQAGSYFEGKYLGRGVARLDWDRDGRPDLVVVHQDADAALLSNATAHTGNYAVLELHGVVSNRDAIGAKIHVTAGGRTQFVEICGGDGFYASNERRQLIGLGAATQIERLQITWPGGRIDQWSDLPTNCELVMIEGQPPRNRKARGN